jgi:hypothetical protein
VDTWSHSLKAFVLLPDVGEENGPCQHVLGSHRLGFSMDSLFFLRGSWPVLPPDPLDQSHLYLDEDQSRTHRKTGEIFEARSRLSSKAGMETSGVECFLPQ